MHLDQYVDVDESFGTGHRDTLSSTTFPHSLPISAYTLSSSNEAERSDFLPPLYSIAPSRCITTPKCIRHSSLLQMHRAAQLNLRTSGSTSSPQPPNSSTSQMTCEGESPTSVDAPLEYITVDSYEWPKDPPRPKRPRLATEEQKRRHRADQKRFMQRKRARFETLRQEATLLELQVQYLEALRDENNLLDERRRLVALQQVQFAACMNGPSVSRPATLIRHDTTNRCDSQNELDTLLVDLFFSL